MENEQFISAQIGEMIKLIGAISSPILIFLVGILLNWVIKRYVKGIDTTLKTLETSQQKYTDKFYTFKEEIIKSQSETRSLIISNQAELEIIKKTYDSNNIRIKTLVENLTSVQKSLSNYSHNLGINQQTVQSIAVQSAKITKEIHKLADQKKYDEKFKTLSFEMTKKHNEKIKTHDKEIKTLVKRIGELRLVTAKK